MIKVILQSRNFYFRKWCSVHFPDKWNSLSYFYNQPEEAGVGFIWFLMIYIESKLQNNRIDNLGITAKYLIYAVHFVFSDSGHLIWLIQLICTKICQLCCTKFCIKIIWLLARGYLSLELHLCNKYIMPATHVHHSDGH